MLALVTGASRGIGAAIARELGKNGYSVVINYCGSEAKAQAVLEDINDGMIIKADVSKYEECEAMVNTVIEKYGRIDLLVNNAGITKDNLIIKMSPDDFDQVIDTNLKGTFNMCKAVARIMMKQRSGRIINMSSVVGISGNPGQANYAASKGGVIALTKTLARELSSRGIMVNAIAPGFIETEMTAVLGEDAKSGILASIPLKRMGNVEDIAKTVMFLANSNYITGQVIQVDGGMLI